MTDLIEREVELPAGPATVWTALTDPDWLREWLADDAEIELRPGGDARFVIDGEERSGWVEEVCPPPLDGGPGARGRIAFWWEAADDDEEGPSRVVLELVGTERGTVVRVVETRPLEALDLVGIPLGGAGRIGDAGGLRYGPSLVAA